MTLDNVACRRIEAKWTNMAFGAASFADVVGRVEQQFPSDDPFTKDMVREIVIMGHGVSIELDRAQAAGIEFGAVWESAETIGTHGSGLLAHALANGATVDIQGCDVAATDRDKSFRWELGRTLFGEGGWGYINAYRKPVEGQYEIFSSGSASLITETSLKVEDPEILIWPDDFPQWRQQATGQAPR